MDRRGFVKMMAGGAVGWVVGGSVLRAQESAPNYANPVPFLTTPELAGFDQGLRASLSTVDAQRTAALQAATFPQSVASGDPHPHGVVLWTRVAPAAQAATDPDLVLWQIASSADFERAAIIAEGAAVISAAHDNTIKLPIQHGALRPYTIYYYRFIYDGISSRTGRFKTLPEADADIQSMKLGYIVCQDYSNGYYTVLGHLAQEEVDAVVHLGDYIYEYRDDGVGGPNNGPVRVVPPYPSGAQYPQNLNDYRHLYQVYRADLDQQAVHERFAYIQLWDDHEFFNDCHRQYHEDTHTAPLNANSPEPLLRQAANRAWSEYGLADVKFDPTKNWENSIRIYRAFKFGKLMDLVVTDERLYRDGPPCGHNQIGQRYQTHGCVEQSDPARTMLGYTQKLWFLDRMTKSKATWKLWANEVMLCQYILQSEFFDLDQWDGYPHERAELLAKIRDAGVQNFVVLSGDAHLFLASYLRTNFNDLTEAPIGVEFMVGAISSGNYLDAGVDKPAPLSAPAAVTKAAALGLPADSLEPFILAQNPHMVFWNGSTWGYGILTITPQQLACEFKVVSTVKQTGGSISKLAGFTVPSGKVQINPA